MFLCVVVFVALIPVVFSLKCSNCQPCECGKIQISARYYCFADCSNRSLYDIPETVPRDVEIFDLSHNYLDGDDIEQLLGFEDFIVDLRLSYNNITHVSDKTFSTTSELRELSLEGNIIDHVTKETFGHLKQLRKLNGIRSHKFGDHSFDNLKGLDFLSIVIESHTVPEIIFRSLKLKTLYLEFTTATSIPTKIFSFGTDTLLEIHLNVPNVTTLHEDTFSGLTILKSLVIRTKKMHTLPQYIFHARKIDNRDMPVNLNSVVIDGVKSLPRSLFDKQQSLKFLSLNNIEDLVLSGTESQVETLDLSGSGIYKTGSNFLKGFRSLRFLNLSRTNLDIMHNETFHSLSSLVVLDLSHNNLEDLPRGLLDPAVNTLTALNISYNKLQNITQWSLGGVKSLEKLDLSHNNIDNINKDALMYQHMLTEILLSDNELVHLSRDTLANQSRLMDMNVARNKLKHLPRGLFRNTRFLRKLDISGNNIQTLPSYLFDGVRRLEFVSLGNNPVYCDCELMELNNQSTRLNLVGHCEEPPEMKGMPLKNLNLDEKCLVVPTTTLFSSSVMKSTPLLSSEYQGIVSSTVYESQASSEILPTSTMFVYPTIMYGMNHNTPEQAQDIDDQESFVGSNGFYVMIGSIAAVFAGLVIGFFIRRGRRNLRSRTYDLGRGHPDFNGDNTIQAKKPSES